MWKTIEGLPLNAQNFVIEAASEGAQTGDFSLDGRQLGDAYATLKRYRGTIVEISDADMATGGFVPEGATPAGGWYSFVWDQLLKQFVSGRGPYGNLQRAIWDFHQRAASLPVRATSKRAAKAAEKAALEAAEPADPA